jgi:hypothetical protein
MSVAIAFMQPEMRKRRGRPTSRSTSHLRGARRQPVRQGPRLQATEKMGRSQGQRSPQPRSRHIFRHRTASMEL